MKKAYYDMRVNKEIKELIEKDLGREISDRYCIKIQFAIEAIKDSYLPIQSVAGIIAESKSEIEDNLEDVEKILEDIFKMSSNIFRIVLTNNDKLIVFNKYRLESFSEEKLPVKLGSYKKLGKFEWDLTYKEHLKILTSMDLFLDEKGIELDYKYGEELAGDDKEKRNKMEVRREFYKNNGNEPFRINWGSDYRGRFYSLQYYINPQGNTIEKNIVNFNEPEKINEDGIKVIKMLVSDLVLDRKISNRKKLEMFNEDMFNVELEDIEDRILLDKYKNMYEAYKENREVSSLVEIDANNSQIQVYSMLFKDKNLMDYFINYRDIYEIYIEKFNERFNSDLKRKDIKKILMTANYGKLKKNVDKELKALAHRKGIDEDEFLEAFYEIGILNDYRDDMNSINSLWDNNFTFSMPDGFKITVKEYGTEKYNFIINDNDEEFHIPMYVGGIIDKKYSLLPFVSIIHSVDAYIMRSLLIRLYKKGIKFIPIHDAVLIGANHVKIFKEEYLKICKEIVRSDLINEILGGRAKVIYGDLKPEDLDLDPLMMDLIS